MKRILTTTGAILLATCVLWAQAQPAQGGQQPAAQPGAQQPAAQPGAQQPQKPQAAPGQAAPGQPEPKKPPQAKTKDEYDAIQKFNDPALTPDQRIAQAEEFLVKYPSSELKSFVYFQEMQAYQQKNDFVNMLDSGEKVLKEDPDHAVTLIMLTSAIPERTRENDLDRDEKLKKAEEYGNRALAAVDKLAKPSPQMADADWNKARNDARGQVYAGLGYVALHRKQYPLAEENFKKATQLQHQKDSIVYWRLGMALQGTKKYEEARDAYKQSVDLGGVKIGTRDLAAEALQQVEDFLKKRGASGAPPAGNPPGKP